MHYLAVQYVFTIKGLRMVDFKPIVMKKISFISSVLLLVLVVTFLFVGCQKESAVAEETTTADAESVAIKSEAGNGSFAGSIDNSYAEALQKNFTTKYNGKDQTLQVAFSAKDLAGFISNLQKKNKADIIYVNFGVYGKGAPAPKWTDNGRLTVFFTGNNNKKKNSGNVRTNDDDNSEKESQSLNHGEMFP